MRRRDKLHNIEKVNLLAEQRYVISKAMILTEGQVNLLIEGIDTKELLNELNETMGGKGLITETLLLDVIGMIKTFLTSHRVAELLTALTKWILKVTGVDTDMTGIKDSCKEAGDEECGKMWIQKLADGLEKVHHKIMGILNYVVAAINNKTFKPSKEQKAEASGVAEKVFKVVVIGCLVYYVGSFGTNAHDLYVGLEGSSIGSLIIPIIGTIAKVSDLHKGFSRGVTLVNSDIAN